MEIYEKVKNQKRRGLKMSMCCSICNSTLHTTGDHRQANKDFEKTNTNGVNDDMDM